MRLSRLEVRNLRILEAVTLAPEGGINLILGDNGSGKTSLLEAVHLLGTGRSFRARGADTLIRRGESELMVYGGVLEPDGAAFPIGVEKGLRSTRIRLDQSEVRNATALARRLPMVLVPPDSQRLLTDGADLRRRLLDWGLFHVEPSYAEVHQQYRRVLQQRNAQLRNRPSPSAMAAWSREIQQAGERLSQLRSAHLGRMLPSVSAFMSQLLLFEVSIHYRQGWDESKDLAQALRDCTARDLARGHTTVGPHRADLGFTVNGTPAQHRLSRGEAKLFCLAVWLAQAQDFYAHAARWPLLLIDDLAAELDAENRRRVFETLEKLGAQVFVTALSKTAVEGLSATGKSFHVERGKVVEMV
ncbi:MAG TPA: DNA replication/repair protein RecF [Gammaproteobacteria bacterium]